MEIQFSLFLVLILSSIFVTKASNSFFNVLDYGAVGNARTDDTSAFLKAWQATCGSDASSTTMMVPSGKTFFVRPLRYEGPCNSQNVTLQIDGNLVAPTNPSNWKCENSNCQAWMYFHQIDGLTVRGHATIDAKGGSFWNAEKDNQRNHSPNTFEISRSNNVFLGDGLTFKDSPHVHVTLNSLTSVVVSNITIDAPGDSQNTDGIHVSKCTDIVIDGAHIGTGDDCISIVDGTSHLTIKNIVCGPGHGISIGSLGHHGDEAKVEYVTVSDVVFIGATNGVRIKTWPGGRGYARHFRFERILSHNTQLPITIDQFYCDKHYTCQTSGSAVQISNITYSQVIGTSRDKTAVSLLCSNETPCRDIILEDIYLVSKDGKEATFNCMNVIGQSRGQRTPDVSCLN